MLISLKARNITESLTLSIDQKAKKMKAEGLDVVGFGAGEPDFITPANVIQAAKDALDKGLTKYTPASGTAELKAAISAKLKRDNKLHYSPEEIIISNGAKHSLYNIFQAILDPDDEVIIPSPYWLSYPEIVRMAYGKPVFVDTYEKDDFIIDIKNLRNAITPRTKAIIINSPNNPTGSVYPEEVLREVAKLAVEKQVLVISDEIYEKIIYDGHKHISIASLGEDIRRLTITINGMSKAYAMTGWRIGYAAGPVEIIKAMTRIQSHSTSNPNSIAQYAATEALNSDDKFTTYMTDELNKRRLFLVDKINEIGLVSCRLPGGAFYVMMNISRLFGKRHKDKLIDSAISFASALLDAKMVTVVPGEAFGMASHVRLSYAVAMDQIEKGMSRIKEFISELED